MKTVATIILCVFIKIAALAQCSFKLIINDSCLTTGVNFAIESSRQILYVGGTSDDSIKPGTIAIESDKLATIHQTYSRIGTHVIVLSVGLWGCREVTMKKEFEVVDCSGACDAAIDFSDSCQDRTIPFTIQSRGIINGVRWNFNDRYSTNNISTTVNSSHVFTKAGTYNIRAIVDLACRKDTVTKK